jgi:hypothetical protein
MATKPKTKAGKQAKVGKVMHEYKTGTLHSGSKSGPEVKSRKQAIAISLSEAGLSKKTKTKKY